MFGCGRAPTSSPVAFFHAGKDADTMRDIRMRPLEVLLAALLICGVAAPQARGEGSAADRTLVLHYTFDKDPGDVAKDLGPHGNDGEIVKAEYLAEFDGRRGVLRFDGEESMLECPNSDSLFFEGDMSFEMWVRLNGPVKPTWASLFRDRNSQYFDFGVSSWHTLVLWYVRLDPVHGVRRHWDPVNGREQMVLPVKRSILSDTWSHIAVVVEYPRCRFYHNGELVRDAYMPVPGIYKVRTGKRIGVQIPIDLDEFRLYRRALTPAEVAAHAKGEEVPAGQAHELAVEPHWYEDTLVMRLSCKGIDYSGYRAEMTLLQGDYTEAAAPQGTALKEAFEGSGRYVASVKFPLSGLENKSLDGVARILGADGELVKTVYRHASLKKPEWVDTREGYSDDVLPPWTPVEAETKADGTVEVRVWGRRHVFGPTPFPRQIETGGAELLASPITLKGRVDGTAFAWENGRVRLKESSKTAASLEQTWQDDRAAFRIDTSIEYDGHMMFDCEVKARRDLSLDELSVEIPLRTRYATLCYGHAVFPWNAEVPITSFHSGEVHGDQAFCFSPIVWLGDEERGLTWHAESDEDWHYSDEFKAIEILPRGETTTFRANLVNVPTQLPAGQSLHYRFALLATPVKPLLRDSWDLRIVRSEPYGRELSLPDRTVDGKPEAQFLAEAGVRHLFTTVCDLWPYPMPIHERYSRLLHRLNEVIHAQGFKHYGYQIHERFPVLAPEFDIHGFHMLQRPISQYIPGTTPGAPRPGPVGVEYGADSQGTQYFCSKSKAAQDAYIHALARRLDEYGGDGVYLDGTCRPASCTNTVHGCGYRLEDGSIRPTFPVFGVREFQKRIYTVVKKRRPDGVVDHHCSFMYNPSALAYADVIWTGEQWWHLKKTGGAPNGYIAGELSLDRFRTEFTGRQLGIASETLHYRLGSHSKVAATSLLHDVPPRPSTPFTSQSESVAARGKREGSFFQLMSKLWRVRDRFGAKEAEKLFYWNNQDYVRVSPEKCHAFLLKHPKNGVLAFITNLRPDGQTVIVEFNLDELGLRGKKLDVFNALTDEPLAMTPDGKLSVPLGSEQWIYIWLRPSADK